MRSAAAIVCALVLGTLGAPLGAADEAIRGFSPNDVAGERQVEAAVLASPSEAAALRHETALASTVHRMGSPADYRSAVYVRDALAKAGWNASIVTYSVPIARPVQQRLVLLDPKSVTLELHEAEIAGDPYSRAHAAIGMPYSGYSVDGDATGPLVYANYARPEDFATLARLGVDVRKAIVIARNGNGPLTEKAYESARRGAAAVLVFADPMDSGYFKGVPYPRGPWRPTSAALRNTLTFLNDPGDPTAIGVPTPDAEHRPFSAIELPPIPETPITGDVVQQLLAAMDGPIAPDDWHGGFPLPLHVGASARAHFTLRSDRYIGRMWDVIATLPGSDPTQSVVVGGHRDAWTYGAIDPVSGTVDLLQLAEAYGKAVRNGWKPRRTVTIGSWDGEELNLFGSATWVDEHAAELRKSMVAYVNTDEVAFGPQFSPYATPELSSLVKAAAHDVTAPDGTALDTYWGARDALRNVEPVGGGSDHEPFVYHENLPALGGGYGGPFGTYHSAYDDLTSLQVFDPGMHRSAAAARFTSLVTMRLADAVAPDIGLAALADALRLRLRTFAGVDATPRRAFVVRALLPRLEAFSKRARALDTRLDEAVSSGDPARAQAAYASVRNAEGAFYAPDGISKDSWSRSLLYGMRDDAPYSADARQRPGPRHGRREIEDVDGGVRYGKRGRIALYVVAVACERPSEPVTRTLGSVACAPGGTSWNSTTLTPESGSASVTRFGAHTLSLQNDATQVFGTLEARSVTFERPLPATIKRYLTVLGMLPGRSAPVHGASDTAMPEPESPSAAIASCPSSRYMSWRSSCSGNFVAAATVASYCARARTASPAAAAVRPAYR